MRAYRESGVRLSSLTPDTLPSIYAVQFDSRRLTLLSIEAATRNVTMHVTRRLSSRPIEGDTYAYYVHIRHKVFAVT